MILVYIQRFYLNMCKSNLKSTFVDSKHHDIVYCWFYLKFFNQTSVDQISNKRVMLLLEMYEFEEF
ncbi:hypothetical protein HanPI659440_Chr05g0195361 [Helianthus annuus]|nr:hypothetical protein HanPI659440_Chr05g0195361 [Helianthus annuus]